MMLLLSKWFALTTNIVLTVLHILVKVLCNIPGFKNIIIKVYEHLQWYIYCLHVYYIFKRRCDAISMIRMHACVMS